MFELLIFLKIILLFLLPLFIYEATKFNIKNNNLLYYRLSVENKDHQVCRRNIIYAIQDIFNVSIVVKYFIEFILKNIPTTNLLFR